MNETTILSDAQYERSWQLARAHQHEWASWLDSNGRYWDYPQSETEDHVVLGSEGWCSEGGCDAPSVAYIQVPRGHLNQPYCREHIVTHGAVEVGPLRDVAAIADHTLQVCRWQYCIAAPELDDAGNVVHTTGTGRTIWLIEPDGTVQVTISRPDGPVLSAAVGPDGTIQAWKYGSPYFQRHVEALGYVLGLLVDPQYAWVQLGDMNACRAPEPNRIVEFMPSAAGTAALEHWLQEKAATGHLAVLGRGDWSVLCSLHGEEASETLAECGERMIGVYSDHASPYAQYGLWSLDSDGTLIRHLEPDDRLVPIQA